MVRIRRLCINVNITNALPIIASNSMATYRMICIRIVVNHDVNDVDGVGLLDKITSAPNSVTGIKLAAATLSFSQVVATVTEVAFIK